MIPDRYFIRICCDACGDSRVFPIDGDTIEADGLEATLEEALRDEGWDSRERMTFCPHCIDRALTMALQSLVHEAARHESKPVEVES